MASVEGDPPRRQFVLFIEDDRYAVPTLEFLAPRNIEAAKEIAEQRLRVSPHHLRVEVLEGDDLLFVVAAPDRADEPSPTKA